jgi:hypothetical protein
MEEGDIYKEDLFGITKIVSSCRHSNVQKVMHNTFHFFQEYIKSFVFCTSICDDILLEVIPQIQIEEQDLSRPCNSL